MVCGSAENHFWKVIEQSSRSLCIVRKHEFEENVPEIFQITVRVFVEEDDWEARYIYIYISVKVASGSAQVEASQVEFLYKMKPKDGIYQGKWSANTLPFTKEL